MNIVALISLGLAVILAALYPKTLAMGALVAPYILAGIGSVALLAHKISKLESKKK